MSATVDLAVMAQSDPLSVVIAILAAGASSRMRGGDKLLELVEGEPVLRRQVRLALATGAPVIVALPPDRPTRAAALVGFDIHITTVPDAHLGMSVSLRAALTVARGLGLGPKAGFMVLPADMPDFTAEALAAMVQAFAQNPDVILRGASEGGQPGHPAIFPRGLWEALDRVTGDQGGRAVLAALPERVRLLPLSGDMAITDLDTPEDWAKWRAKRGY